MKKKIKILFFCVATMLASAFSYQAMADWYCFDTLECHCVNDPSCEGLVVWISEEFVDCESDTIHCASEVPGGL